MLNSPRMIYGKLFKKLYHGSMVGKGLAAFALMPYVVAHMEPASDREEYVNLNALELATTFGAKVEEVQGAIDFLCAPDKDTDTPGEQGKRLVQKSRYLFWVVNGRFYREIMNEEEQREKAAARQRKHREKLAADQLRKLGRKVRQIPSSGPEDENNLK